MLDCKNKFPPLTNPILLKYQNERHGKDNKCNNVHLLIQGETRNVFKAVTSLASEHEVSKIDCKHIQLHHMQVLSVANDTHCESREVF